MNSLLKKLRDDWLRQGIHLNRVATESQIQDFEAKYQLMFPSDFREYFLGINGLPDGELDGLARLWSLNEICRLSERFAEGQSNLWLPYEVESYFVFGDYNIEGSLWVIKLSNTENSGNTVIVVYEFAQVYQKVASKFEEFIGQYVTESPESLI